jgi:hypothetical protein
MVSNTFNTHVAYNLENKLLSTLKSTIIINVQRNLLSILIFMTATRCNTPKTKMATTFAMNY